MATTCDQPGPCPPYQGSRRLARHHHHKVVPHHHHHHQVAPHHHHRHHQVAPHRHHQMQTAMVEATARAMQPAVTHRRQLRMVMA